MNQEEIQLMLNEDPVSCPLCECNDSHVLGILGDRVHLRCGNCGVNFNFLLDPYVSK
jgi:hypothetical protein